MKQYAGNGRALLAYNTDNEQGFAFETHDHNKWHPVDHEGLTLILRPHDQTTMPASHPVAGARPPGVDASETGRKRCPVCPTR
ncbi:hypothetical protein GCM10010405_15460 [Streptomyces macrosporus]|uniref:Uncharacterized protein n=1 Tax=Streptomyces macrosporus TaxID=44032 RepID=A0ABP5WSK4_9ACTN